jgi:endonuclease/exonuclease/phosphatase (EEP) superfamily protein YafD
MNISKLIQNKFVEITLAIFLLVGVLIVIITPDISFFKWTASFATQTTILYILCGIIFLIFKQERLLFVCLFCAGCLSLFLKGNFNPNFKLSAKSTAPSINIVLIKIAEKYPSASDLISIIQNNPDILCLQKPDSTNLQVSIESLKKKYPYSVGFAGKSCDQIILSKFPFLTIDTLQFDGNAQILYSLKLSEDSKSIYFINSYFDNPYDEDQPNNYRYNLGRLIVFLKPIKSPLVVAGSFNAVSWAPELNYFKKSLDIQDSRRAFYPSLPNPFEVPKDHVFFSKNFSCTDFHELRDVNGNHIGLASSFQLTPIDHTINPK